MVVFENVSTAEVLHRKTFVKVAPRMKPPLMLMAVITIVLGPQRRYSAPLYRAWSDCLPIAVPGPYFQGLDTDSPQQLQLTFIS